MRIVDCWVCGSADWKGETVDEASSMSLMGKLGSEGKTFADRTSTDGSMNLWDYGRQRTEIRADTAAGRLDADRFNKPEPVPIVDSSLAELGAHAAKTKEMEEGKAGVCSWILQNIR
jgi:hypothetical protein